jgi:hypothetical protein
VDAVVFPGTISVARRGRHRRCARCGKVVSRRAIVCRRCGKKQRVNPRTTMLLLASVFLIALFAVATLGMQSPSFRLSLSWLRAKDVSPAVLAPPLAAPSPGMLTAAELWGFYSVDPAKADVRFKDRIIDLTGTVSDVRRDFRGNVMLKLATGEPFDNVRAIVLGHDDGARVLPARGQVVALRCTGRGSVIGAPQLDGCVQL